VIDKQFRLLATFRQALRQFQFFSEQASRELGLTAQQYQALLAIRGNQTDEAFTVKALAEKLLIKHNSAVELVDRMEQLRLVARKHTERDRRRVVVELTAHGASVLRRLVIMHRRELHRIAPEFSRYFRNFAKPLDAIE
jgi:DNA-binding MarR family transcriptional regulator